MHDSISVLWQPTRLWALLKQTALEWNDDKVPRLGAALAYYTIFSIVPMLVVIITVIGLVLGIDAAQSYVIDQLAELLGPQGAEAIKEMVERASQPRTGVWATLIATLTLLFGASGFFGQLQEALNDIWGIEAKPGAGVWAYVKARFVSLATVLGTGFLLMASLILSAGLAAFGKWYAGWLPAPEIVLRGLDFVVSLTVITGLFAMIFKFLPDADIAWKDVWIGAALTAALFVIGKFAIGLYIGQSDFGTVYGAAGSLVILLVWIYYSTQILLFGAEFTQVFANAEGTPVTSSEFAVAMEPAKSANPLPRVPPSNNSSQAPASESPTRFTEEKEWPSALLMGNLHAVWTFTRRIRSPLLRRSLLVAGTLMAVHRFGRHRAVSSVSPRQGAG